MPIIRGIKKIRDLAELAYYRTSRKPKSSVREPLELRRLKERGGALRGYRGSAEFYQKFGTEIRPHEQREVAEYIADEMRISGGKKERFISEMSRPHRNQDLRLELERMHRESQDARAAQTAEKLKGAHDPKHVDQKAGQQGPMRPLRDGHIHTNWGLGVGKSQVEKLRGDITGTHSLLDARRVQKRQSMMGIREKQDQETQILGTVKRLESEAKSANAQESAHREAITGHHDRVPTTPHDRAEAHSSRMQNRARVAGEHFHPPTGSGPRPS